MHLILASSSPRRQMLLKDLKIPFKIISPDIDEQRLKGEPAINYVKRISLLKALKAAQTQSLLPSDFNPNSFIESSKVKTIYTANNIDLSEPWAILAADTIVFFQNKILGKPKSKQDAFETLKKLSGKTHEVITAFCWLVSFDNQLSCVQEQIRSKVSIIDKEDSFWKWYVATGEPMDKAGSYAGQGIGMSFVHRIQGSFSNVVGLPTSHVIESFNKNYKTNFHKTFS